MDTKERVRQQFGRSAAAYATSDAHARGDSLSILVGLVAPAATWEALDVGTGAGHTALAVAPHVARVIATDLTPEMLAETARLARERGLANVETRPADAEALPSPDATFDLVTCRLAFHHFPHPDTAVRELARVLKPGGVLGFADNITVEDPAGARAYNDYERLRDPSHHEVLPLSRLIALFESTGLHVEATRSIAKEFEFHLGPTACTSSRRTRHGSSACSACSRCRRSHSWRRASPTARPTSRSGRPSSWRVASAEPRRTATRATNLTGRCEAPHGAGFPLTPAAPILSAWTRW